MAGLPNRLWSKGHGLSVRLNKFLSEFRPRASSTAWYQQVGPNQEEDQAPFFSLLAHVFKGPLQTQGLSA